MPYALRHSLIALLVATPSAAQRAPASATVGDGPINPFLVAISVSSISRSVAWYQRHLGFQVQRTVAGIRPGVATALLVRDGFYVEIAELVGSTPGDSVLPLRGSSGSLQGIFKLGFWVSDVDSAVVALEHAGVPRYGAPAADSGMRVRHALVRDPDGTVIQLFGPIQNGPGACGGAEHCQFDFWLGAWDVQRANGAAAGVNRIERVLGGCAITERWISVSPYRGCRSTFTTLPGGDGIRPGSRMTDSRSISREDCAAHPW